MILKNILLTIFGLIMLAFGAIGIFLPIWPTTPFVLLAVASLSANPSLQKRILKIKFINEHAVNYRLRTGLQKSNVVLSLSFLWVSMGISIFASKTTWITVLLLLIGIAVTTHILWIAKPRRRDRKR